MIARNQERVVHQDRLARLVRVAIMGSMGFMLMYFGEIQIPFFADFLKYDPGDIPAMVTAFTMGPGAGVAVQAIKSGLFWLSGKSTAGVVGVLANFFAGASLVLTAGIVRRLLSRADRRSWMWDLVAVACGTVVMSALMIPANALVVYPLWGWSGAAAWKGALLISTPFNLFKGALSSALSLAFYRRLEPLLAGGTHPKSA
ncbi:MAG TPA: ECF transporter S component [Symbiobacteriaceae bacterium]